MSRVGVKLTIILCSLLFSEALYGAYQDPTVRTNVNDKTDLFEKEIKDYSAFRDHMDSLKTQAVDSIGSSENIGLITDKPVDEIKAKANDLSSIRASELEAKGREEIVRTGIMEELHVDYTNPLNTQHQKDAARIAEASGALLGKLTDLFKDFGIDCQTVKGNKQIEPEYYIDIKQEQIKDTVYTKSICEEPRNKYNCRDILTMRCQRRGIQWGPWEYRQIDIPGYVVYHQAKHLGYAVHWKRKRWGWHLNFGKQYEWRVYLSGYLSIPLEQISEQISFPGNWGGSIGEPPVNIGEEYRHVYPYYRFGYHYRNGHEICEQWSEDWSETCILQ